MTAPEPGGPGEYDGEAVRDLADRMRLVAAWGERGLCQACGAHPATRLMPAAGELRAVKLCESCAVGEETVPLPPRPGPGEAGRQAAKPCQRCGGPRPESSLRLCRRCGRDLVRRCQAYQVVAVAGLGAGRSPIDVRVGVN